MHHSLRFYSRYRELFVRYYMFQAKWTKIPVLGSVVRLVANVYAKGGSSAHLLTLGEASEIVESSAGLALGPCTCRTVFGNCDNMINAEIMVGTTQNIFMEERPADYREITRQEAKDILRQSRENGLIHTIVKCRQDYYAICNCCPCCCVPLRLKKKYGIGNALVRNDDIVRKFREGQLY